MGECCISCRVCIVFVLFVCFQMYPVCMVTSHQKSKSGIHLGTWILTHFVLINQPGAVCIILVYSSIVVVVGPTTPPKMVEGSNNRFYAHRLMLSPHLASIRARWLTGDSLHSTSRCPTSTGAVHKSVTFSVCLCWCS